MDSHPHLLDCYSYPSPPTIVDRFNRPLKMVVKVQTIHYNGTTKYKVTWKEYYQGKWLIFAGKECGCEGSIAPSERKQLCYS